jgi:hypothetical protein
MELNTEDAEARRDSMLKPKIIFAFIRVFRGHESWIFNVDTHFASLRVFRGLSFRLSFSVIFIIHMTLSVQAFSRRSEPSAFSRIYAVAEVVTVGLVLVDYEKRQRAHRLIGSPISDRLY